MVIEQEIRKIETAREKLEDKYQKNGDKDIQDTQMVDIMKNHIKELEYQLKVAQQEKFNERL